MTQATPPGRYPDPGQTNDGPATERWWDGTAWTDQVRPTGSAPAWDPPAPGTAAGPAYPAQPAYPAYPAHPGYPALSVSEALLVAGATAALIGVLSRPRARPGLRHAAASGIASGVASALTQTVTVAVTGHPGPLPDVRVIGVALLVAVFAAGGLLLSQTAYRSGLDAPLAVVTLTNPVAAAVIGLCLLGERFRGGPTEVLLALTGAALASWGVILLTRATPRPGRQEHAAPGPAERPAARRSAVEHPAGPSPAPSTDLLAGPLVTHHPVAAVLAPQSGSAAPEPAPVPRPRHPAPEHLTAPLWPAVGPWHVPDR
ncbi:hypothetical protein SHIRM173S_09831 [Streptomyces hirsutus]